MWSGQKKRTAEFRIANGDELKVPSNFVILGNDEPIRSGRGRGGRTPLSDASRRFQWIPMPIFLDEFLTDNGMEEALKNRVLGWFSRINGHANKNAAASVGHAYFATATDEASLSDVWEYQLKYLVQRSLPPRRTNAPGARNGMGTHLSGAGTATFLS